MEFNFDNLYKNVTDIFVSLNDLDVTKIVLLTPRIVQLIQEVGIINNMSGQEKKNLYFLLINKIIENSSLNNDEKKALKTFVDTLLPVIVDSIVFAYKSEAFNEIKKKLKKKCSLLCS